MQKLDLAATAVLMQGLNKHNKHTSCLRSVSVISNSLTQHDVLLKVVMLEAFGRSPKSGGHVNGTVTLGLLMLGLMLVHVGTATCREQITHKSKS
jgi:hypothetical protein